MSTRRTFNGWVAATGTVMALCAPLLLAAGAARAQGAGVEHPAADPKHFDAKGQPQWESQLMAKCGRIAESLGLERGGSWKGFQDTSQIQIKICHTLAEGRQLL